MALLIAAVSSYLIAKYDLFWHDCVASMYGSSGIKNKDIVLFCAWVSMSAIISLLICLSFPGGLSFFAAFFVVCWLSFQLFYKILENEYTRLDLLAGFLIFVILCGCAMSLVAGFPLLLGLFGPAKVVLSFELFKISFVAGLANPIFFLQSLILSLVFSNLIFKFKYQGLSADLLVCLYRVKELYNISAAKVVSVLEEEVYLDLQSYNANLRKIHDLLTQNPNMKIDFEKIKNGAYMRLDLDVLCANIAELEGKKVGDEININFNEVFYCLFHLYDESGFNRFQGALNSVTNEEQAKAFLIEYLRIRNVNDELSEYNFVPIEFAENESLINIIIKCGEELRDRDNNAKADGAPRLLTG